MSKIHPQENIALVTVVVLGLFFGPKCCNFAIEVIDTAATAYGYKLPAWNNEKPEEPPFHPAVEP